MQVGKDSQAAFVTQKSLCVAGWLQAENLIPLHADWSWKLGSSHPHGGRSLCSCNLDSVGEALGVHKHCLERLAEAVGGKGEETNDCTEPTHFSALCSVSAWSVLISYLLAPHLSIPDLTPPSYVLSVYSSPQK